MIEEDKRSIKSNESLQSMVRKLDLDMEASSGRASGEVPDWTAHGDGVWTGIVDVGTHQVGSEMLGREQRSGVGMMYAVQSLRWMRLNVMLNAPKARMSV